MSQDDQDAPIFGEDPPEQDETIPACMVEQLYRDLLLALRSPLSPSGRFVLMEGEES